MSIDIHPTAIIEDGAQLAAGVKVGAYAYVGARVTLGENTYIHHHATVDGYTQLGAHNEVFSYAYIGGQTHDLKYTGGQPGLKIGDHNIFREYVTVHVATKEGEWTCLGSHNVILAYSHIAHDCQVGNHMVMSSHAALGGHVQVGDHVNIGWGAGVHQFCRIGSYAMVGAASKLVQDAGPYSIVDGNPAQARAINRLGLTRSGFPEGVIREIYDTFKLFYRSGLNRQDACAQIKARYAPMPEHIQYFLDFIQHSERGLA